MRKDQHLLAEIQNTENPKNQKPKTKNQKNQSPSEEYRSDPACETVLSREIDEENRERTC